MNRRAIESLASVYMLVHGIAIAALIISNAAGTALFQITVGTSVIDSFAVAFQRPPSAMTSLVGSAGSLLGWSILIACLVLGLFAMAIRAIWKRTRAARGYGLFCAILIAGAWLVIVATSTAGWPTLMAGLIDCLIAAGIAGMTRAPKRDGPA